MYTINYFRQTRSYSLGIKFSHARKLKNGLSYIRKFVYWTFCLCYSVHIYYRSNCSNVLAGRLSEILLFCKLFLPHKKKLLKNALMYKMCN